MKRNLFALAILLLPFSGILRAQSNGIEFYHFNSDNIRVLESILQYNSQPFENTIIDILGQSSWEDRLNFNQDTRRSLLGSRFSYLINTFQHGLVMDYESFYDASDLEPTAYINKNGKLGYQINWTPTDSLNLNLEAHGLIRNEQDRYLQDNYRHSDGYRFLARSSYRMENNFFNAGIQANADRKIMNWESYQDVSARADFGAQTNALYWESSFGINHRSDDVYNLVHDSDSSQSSYVKQDLQKRSNLNLHSFLEYSPGNHLSFHLSERYSERRTVLKENTIRNNGEFQNNLDVGLSYAILTNVNLGLQANHSYSIKDFNIEQNTRHIENRNLSATTGWEYSPFDSLFAGAGISLQRTTFPSSRSWDNDLRNRYARLGWKHYYRDLIRVSNWFTYSFREDVYTNALLSANNHSQESFSFLPEATILLGDRIAFVQNYQIRTDYTDYLYKNKRTDKLYRQMVCKYNLVFDSYPYVARSGDARWFSLPYRSNKGSAFLADINFAYEENQSGEKEGDFYNINSKNRKYVAGVVLKHDIGNFYYSIEPHYSWGTWQEYSLKAGTYWSFNDGSFLALGINPVAEDFNKIDWRSSVNLSIIF